jgi:hypothetical protein
MGYALLKDADPHKRFWQGTVRTAIALSVAVTMMVVSVAAFVCIAGEALLPRVMLDSLAMAIRRDARRAAKYFRHHRALAPATVNA